MTQRFLLLFFALAMAGCGPTASPTPPATQKAPAPTVAFPVHVRAFVSRALAGGRVYSWSRLAPLADLSIHYTLRLSSMAGGIRATIQESTWGQSWNPHRVGPSPSRSIIFQFAHGVLTGATLGSVVLSAPAGKGLRLPETVSASMGEQVAMVGTDGETYLLSYSVAVTGGMVDVYLRLGAQYIMLHGGADSAGHVPTPTAL